jgi:hypothetical protein
MNASEKIQVLIATIDRHWSQAMQSENQRATTTNFLLTLYGATQAYIIQRNFDSPTILVSIIFITLSTYGIIVTYKYYERFRLHASRVGRLMDKITEFEPSLNLDEIEKLADQKHKSAFGKIAKMRLYKIWLLLHVWFGLLAVFNLIVATLKNYFCYTLL